MWKMDKLKYLNPPRSKTCQTEAVLPTLGEEPSHFVCQSKWTWDRVPGALLYFLEPYQPFSGYKFVPTLLAIQSLLCAPSKPTVCRKPKFKNSSSQLEILLRWFDRTHYEFRQQPRTWSQYVSGIIRKSFPETEQAKCHNQKVLQKMRERRIILQFLFKRVFT